MFLKLGSRRSQTNSHTVHWDFNNPKALKHSPKALYWIKYLGLLKYRKQFWVVSGVHSSNMSPTDGHAHGHAWHVCPVYTAILCSGDALVQTEKPGLPLHRLDLGASRSTRSPTQNTGKSPRPSAFRLLPRVPVDPPEPDTPERTLPPVALACIIDISSSIQTQVVLVWAARCRRRSTATQLAVDSGFNTFSVPQFSVPQSVSTSRS